MYILDETSKLGTKGKWKQRILIKYEMERESSFQSLTQAFTRQRRAWRNEIDKMYEHPNLNHTRRKPVFLGFSHSFS